MARKTSRCIHKAPTPTQLNNMSILIQITFGNRSWAQDLHRITCYGEDRRFQSMGATPPIKDQRNHFTQFRLDILSRDRTDSPESVRTRSSQWGTKPSQDLLEKRMGCDSDGNALGASRDQIGHFGMLWEDQGQGAGPKGRGQTFHQIPLLQRSKPDNSVQPSDFRKMNDQGVGQGTPLSLKDPCKSQRLEGISRQAIDSLGGQPHNSTAPENLRGFFNPLLASLNPRTQCRGRYRSINASDGVTWGGLAGLPWRPWSGCYGISST